MHEIYYWLIGFLILAGLFKLAFLYLEKLNRQKPLKYKAAGPLLSPAEQKFFNALQAAFGQTYWIQMKVNLADIIQPEARYRTSKWQIGFNKISSKHVDFVLCHPETYEVVAIFELDDSSHNKQDRKERDAFVDQALTSAGIPIHHIKASNQYDPQDLFNLLTTDDTD
jgi:hypothetical protein